MGKPRYRIGAAAYQRKYWLEHPEWRMYTSAKYRAERLGIPFSIKLEDVVIPKVCPVLAIPLFFTEGRVTANTPSLDRIDSTKGYEPGNVAVISWRANKYKSDMTITTIKRLCDYVSEKVA